MKLSKLLLVGFATMALAGCDLFGKKTDDEEPEEYALMPEVTGGTEEDKNAIYDALNNKPICQKNGTSVSNIRPNKQATLEEDEGDNVKLTLKQTAKSKTVVFTWACSDSQEYFGGFLNPSDDQFHQFIEINYKHYAAKTEEGSLTWSISKIQCGDAVAANPGVSYRAKIINEQINHPDVHISDVYAFSSDTYEHDYTDGTHLKFPSTFDVVDYDKEYEQAPSPYYRTTDPEAEKKYYYCNVFGKVIYLAPDGNFGLIADGNDVLEIYAGAGTALKESNFPHLKVGNVVKITGNLSQYCGNMQLGFITKVVEAPASSITAPSNEFREITESKIASLTKSGFTTQSQAVKLDDVNMMGSLRTVTGTYVADSMKNCTGKAEESTKWPSIAPGSMDATKRIMFKIAVGSAQYTVYYDKHSNSTSDNIFAALKSKLEAGGSITIKGFSRYFGDNEDGGSFAQEGKTAATGYASGWTIVPFSASHIS